MGKGNIRIQVHGITQVITEVFYIPELKINLLSIGQLQEKDLAILVQHGVFNIFNSVRGLIMQTNMSANRMFGHLNLKVLRTLAYRKLVMGLPNLKASSKICTGCVVGKQHRNPFSKKSLWRASQPLYLMHSDICAPITPESNSYKRHVHIPDVKKKKLDNKSFICVYLGVSEESKAYRMYDSESKKIVTSRDKKVKKLVKIAHLKKDKLSKMAHLKKDKLSKMAHLKKDKLSKMAHLRKGKLSKVMIVAPNHETSSVQGRIRKEPVWIKDYERGDGLSKEEEIQQLVMFTTSSDLVTFEEAAVKSSIWRDAMDLEVKAIKKGEVDKCKGRLVVKGYSQQASIDYTEVFAHVARWDTIRQILALASSRDWKVYQLGVRSAFLHGEISEEVFIEQHRGYEVKVVEDKVYRLKKTLYGLKQAPRAWYSIIESYFIKEGFDRCLSEHTLFVRKGNKDGNILIVSLCVDDIIFIGNTEMMFKDFKRSIKQEFDMSDLGRIKYFLGVERVFWYLRGTTEMGILYKRGGEEDLIVFSNSNCKGDLETAKALQAVFKLSLGAVTWSSKKQPVVTLSTIEAQFIAAASCACQSIWMQRILRKLGLNQSKCAIFCDNSSAIKLSKNLVMHGRSKHIDI
ncbi:uncharacterized protein [Typha latifolia]|uniref:uncharacterized protein n=1 Tax=Typha latifolia TaxID=4733 RepID=UPI003C3054C2